MPKARRKAKRKVKKENGLDLEPGTRSAISGIIQICTGVLLILVLQQRAGMAGNAANAFLTFFF
jgi:hypothetical protein